MRLPISEDGYNAYVQAWREERAEEFAVEHAEEDWFLDLYDADRETERESAAGQRAVSAAQHLFELARALPETGDASDSSEAVTKFREFVPDLDIPPGASSKDAKGEAPLRVGAGEAEPPFLVFLPRVNGAVKCSELTTAVAQTLRSLNKSVETTSSNATNTDEDAPAPGPGDADADANMAGSDENQQEPCNFEIVFGDPPAAIGVSQLGVAGEGETQRGRRAFERDGWIICSSQEQVDRLLDTKSIEVDGHTISLREPKLRSNRTIFADAAHPLRIKRDLMQATQLAAALDRSRSIAPGCDDLLSLPNITALIAAASLPNIDMDLAPAEKEADFVRAAAYEKRQLDIVLGYLRNVHFLCYYGHTLYMSRGALWQGSSLPYLRPAQTSATLLEHARASLAAIEQASGDASSAAQKWAPATPEAQVKTKAIDGFVVTLLERLRPERIAERQASREADLKRAEELKQSAIQSYCDAQTKREGPERFRCLLPPYKAFSDPKFVHRHIRKMHADNLAKVEAEARIAHARERFNKADLKPLPPLPSYAAPKSRTAFIAQHYPYALNGGAAAVAETAAGGPGAVSSSSNLKFRTVVDYSDL